MPNKLFVGVRRSGLRMIRTFRAGLLWLLAAVVTYTYGGVVESALFPVLGNQEIRNVRAYLTDDGRYQVCWVWSYHRQRITTVMGAEFYGTMGNRPFVFVTVGPGDSRLAGLKAVSTGDDQTIPLCANLPPKTVALAEVRVASFAFFRPDHGLWVLRQRGPDVVWDPEANPAVRLPGSHSYDGLMQPPDKSGLLINRDFAELGG